MPAQQRQRGEQGAIPTATASAEARPAAPEPELAAPVLKRLPVVLRDSSRPPVRHELAVHPGSDGALHIRGVEAAIFGADGATPAAPAALATTAAAGARTEAAVDADVSEALSAPSVGLEVQVLVSVDTDGGGAGGSAQGAAAMALDRPGAAGDDADGSDGDGEDGESANVSDSENSTLSVKPLMLLRVTACGAMPWTVVEAALSARFATAGLIIDEVMAAQVGSAWDKSETLSVLQGVTVLDVAQHFLQNTQRCGLVLGAVDHDPSDAEPQHAAGLVPVSALEMQDEHAMGSLLAARVMQLLWWQLHHLSPGGVASAGDVGGAGGAAALVEVFRSVFEEVVFLPASKERRTSAERNALSARAQALALAFLHLANGVKVEVVEAPDAGSEQELDVVARVRQAVQRRIDLQLVATVEGGAGEAAGAPLKEVQARFLVSPRGEKAM